MWVREKLSELLITQGSYNLQVHPINIPHDINAVIKLRKKSNRSPEKTVNRTFLWLTFSRTQNLGHLPWRGCKCYTRRSYCLFIFLGCKRKESLLSSSASIMDLIHICEHKLNLRKLTVRKRYTVGETDLWVPSLNLGVEVRDSWNPNEEIEIIRVLSDTNFRLKPANLCLVSPDDLSDEAFKTKRNRKAGSDWKLISYQNRGFW